MNAEDVPYVVLPQREYGVDFMRDAGIRLGDLAVVTRGGLCSFGIVADVGHAFWIGEGSLKTHEELRNPQCATAG